MGANQSQTHWCFQQVDLSRNPSKANLQNINIAQEMTIKKINPRPQQKISDENSLVEINSQPSQSSQFLSIKIEDLQKSKAYHNPCKQAKRQGRILTRRDRLPSKMNKKSESSSNGIEYQTQNTKQLSQGLSGNYTNSSNSRGSIQNDSKIDTSSNKFSNRLRSPSASQLLKIHKLRSISIEASRPKTSRNQSENNYKITQNVFMASNIGKRNRSNHKPIFQRKKSNKPFSPRNGFQIASSTQYSQRQTIQLENGDTFEGLLAYSGEFEGEGIYTMTNGSVFKGVFREGKAHGVGSYHGADGFNYEGEWVDNAPHGYGKAIYKNLSTYAGYFKRGKRHGTGFFTQGNTSYHGDFVEDMMEGYGVYLSQNGQIYEGEWLNDCKHGKGLHKLANGDIYEGEFQEDEKQGYGVLKYTNGSYFAGFWWKGQIDRRRRQVRIQAVNTMKIADMNKKML